MTANPMSLSATWSAVASGYTGWTMALLAPYSRDAIDALRPRQDAFALDVACGPGTLTLQLAPQVAHVDALDFSERMLEKLHARLADQPAITNVAPLHGDGQALPYDEARFDMAFSMFGLIFFPDRLKALRELHRVLKPGASLALSAWVPLEHSPAFGLYRAIFEGLLEGMPQPPSSELALETLLDEVREAGFVDVSHQRISHDMVVEEHEAFWQLMREGTAPMIHIREQAGDAWPEMERRAKAAYLDHVGDALPARYAMPADLVLAKRP